jgi:hypothetical protein
MIIRIINKFKRTPMPFLVNKTLHDMKEKFNENIKILGKKSN